MSEGGVGGGKRGGGGGDGRGFSALSREFRLNNYCNYPVKILIINMH